MNPNEESEIASGILEILRKISLNIYTGFEEEFMVRGGGLAIVAFSGHIIATD